MKKIIIIVLAIPALVLSVTASGYARGYGHGNWHGHGSHVRFSGGVWVGPGWGAVWPGPFYPSYYPYYRYYAPPVVIQPRQQEYISRDPETEEQEYWYYCRKPEGYYPYINKCPGGWMKVVPPPEAPQGEE
jgi:hypothetical protein